MYSLHDLLEVAQVMILSMNLVLILIINYKTNTIHDSTNSLKDELVREVRARSFAQGRKSRGK